MRPDTPRPLRPAPVLLLAVLASGPAPADAQVRASERATVSQTVDGTVIEIDYARPRARERSPIFGNVVHWGEVWTPGANDATTLEINRDIELNGQAVPAGIYSMWLVVEDAPEWELVLDPRDSLFHTERPEVTDEQIRFMVPVEETEPVEILTFDFPTYSSTRATLALAWGEKRVPFEIEVEPSIRQIVTDEEAVPLVGEWEMTFAEDGPLGEGTVPFVVEHRDDGTLRATTRFPGAGWPDPLHLRLQPLAEGAFLPGMLVGDELMDSFQGTVIEFVYEDGVAVDFAFRGGNDRVLAEGTRR